jgi:hypothetical protein
MRVSFWIEDALEANGKARAWRKASVAASLVLIAEATGLRPIGHPLLLAALL